MRFEDVCYFVFGAVCLDCDVEMAGDWGVRSAVLGYGMRVLEAVFSFICVIGEIEG